MSYIQDYSLLPGKNTGKKLQVWHLIPIYVRWEESWEGRQRVPKQSAGHFPRLMNGTGLTGEWQVAPRGHADNMCGQIPCQAETHNKPSHATHEYHIFNKYWQYQSGYCNIFLSKNKRDFNLFIRFYQKSQNDNNMYLTLNFYNHEFYSCQLSHINSPVFGQTTIIYQVRLPKIMKHSTHSNKGTLELKLPSRKWIIPKLKTCNHQIARISNYSELLIWACINVSYRSATVYLVWNDISSTTTPHGSRAVDHNPSDNAARVNLSVYSTRESHYDPYSRFSGGLSTSITDRVIITQWSSGDAYRMW